MNIVKAKNNNHGLLIRRQNGLLESIDELIVGFLYMIRERYDKGKIK
jgi:hypothetical protein